MTIMNRFVFIFIGSIGFTTIPGYAGSFIFSGESNGIELITHPSGYDGTGGVLTVGVCIEASSPNAANMVRPVNNIVNTFNKNQAIEENLYLGSTNNIPVNFFDFESVALHEVGHCIGLAHPNAALESGLNGANLNYTKATDGANNVFDINSGVDTVIGSSDDVRGDDVNLHWFKNVDNNPCNIYGGTADSTTFSLNSGSLPAGHNFAANADRSVCNSLGILNTEAAMQQGSFSDEDQRALAQDDISTLALAKSGIDEIAGTADDYTISLVSHGAVANPGSDPNCDLILDFDNAQTGFAVCQTTGSFIAPNHVKITSANMFFNNSFNWYFNDDFCSFASKQSGTDISLNAETISNGQRYRATNNINSTNFTVENNACVNYSAANKITLGAGFAVKEGGLFRAEVE